MRSRYEVTAYHADASPTFSEAVYGDIVYVSEGLYAANFAPTIAPGRHTIVVFMQKEIEVQRVSLTGLGVGQGGSFRLVMGLESTPYLAWDVPAAQVKAALEALDAVRGSVTVTRTYTDTTITFDVAFDEHVGDVPLMSWDDTLLLPDPTATVTVTEVKRGTRVHIKTYMAPVVPETQVISVRFASGSPAPGGTFQLSFGGETTDPIAYGASAGTVKAELQRLSFIGSVLVSSASNAFSGTDYTLVFEPTEGTSTGTLYSINETATVSTFTYGDVPTVAYVNSLSGNTPTISVTPTAGRSPFVATIITAPIASANSTTYDSDVGFQHGTGLSTGIYDRSTYFRIQARVTASTTRGPRVRLARCRC